MYGYSVYLCKLSSDEKSSKIMSDIIYKWIGQHKKFKF